VTTPIPEDVLQESIYFPTSVYQVKRVDFLDQVSKTADKYLKKAKKTQKFNNLYPVFQTDNMYEDPAIEDFINFVGTTAETILVAQGYKMDDMEIFFNEMWVQEHHRTSLMEQHIHGYGSQISGFYFLKCPENCSKIVIHDPRPGKVQLNLPEVDYTNATYASNMINFTPEAGKLFFANSWLPHSFSKHDSKEPLTFIHFNLEVRRSITPVVNQSNPIII
jgi:uncharacterized protein (TIGR02466 family)